MKVILMDMADGAVNSTNLYPYAGRNVSFLSTNF